MGWLFNTAWSRRSLIADRIKDEVRSVPGGITVTHQCLAHCYRGNAFRGVLWSVWANTASDASNTAATSRHINCDILEYRNGEWGYKDIDESMGPYYTSCPISYLDMVPVVAEPLWRKAVLAAHAATVAKSNRTRQLRKLART